MTEGCTVLESEGDDDHMVLDRDRVTRRGVSLATRRGLVEADATVLVTLEALEALEPLVAALDRGFALDLEPLEPLEPLGAWEGVAAAVLERVSNADVWSAKRECKGYVIT